MRIWLIVLLLAVVVVSLTAFLAVRSEKHVREVRHPDDTDFTVTHEDWQVGLWFSPWYTAHRRTSPFKTIESGSAVVGSWSWAALLVAAGAALAARRVWDGGRADPPAPADRGGM